MYYVRDDENIAAEIKQLIFKRAGKPSSRYSEGFCFTLAY